MFNLIYLDDEKAELIEPIRKRLELDGKLSVKLQKPISFEAQAEQLAETISNLDGLILDLQLNGVQEGGNRVIYQAPSLAQQLRMYASDGSIKDIPIILCSTNEKIRISYVYDFTSHDLFDWTFLKNEISENTIQKIVSIINAYTAIRESASDINSILHRDLKLIDERILSRFVGEEKIVTHELARVVFKDIIQENGILINEFLLAARLGINYEASDQWEEVKTVFAEATYKGIFGDGWSRWWNDLVLEKFQQLTGHKLGLVGADKRVELLKKATGIERTVEAKPLPYNASNRFWNYCQATKAPLDPFEGYKVLTEDEPKPWQEYSYVSFFALIERFAERAQIKIHPAENERFNEALQEVEE